MKIKGSYFPNEDWDFSDSGKKLDVFVEMLKSRGCKIGTDWHIRSRKGNLMSKLTRNGYWLTMAAFNKKCYYFCEHRVIYTWLKGHIPYGMQVNHKDYNRGNNNIDNLELLAPKENVAYSKCHSNPPVGERSGRAKFTDKQASTIKFLCTQSGWGVKAINDFLGNPCTDSNISRIVNGKRYPNAVTPTDILEVYPTIVDFTRNKKIGIVEEIKNYSMGLCGEVGELVDLMKKMMYHDKDVQPVDVILELGDIMYYLTAISMALGFDIDLVAANNNAKLLARYPNGFDTVKSNERIEDTASKLKESYDNLMISLDDLVSIMEESDEESKKIDGNGDFR